MRINTNVSAINAHRNLWENNNEVSKSMTKLSSGFRINRAADDAAGLGIANRLRADTRSLNQASKNAEQANSLLQVAEGATQSIQKMLERMKELATQAGSDTVDTAGRTRIQTEYEALRDEITRTVNTTKFQGKTLLDGTFSAKVDTTATTSNFNGLVGAGTISSLSISGAKVDDYTITNGASGAITITDGETTQTKTGAAGATVNFDDMGISFKLSTGFNTAVTTNFSTNSLLTISAGAGGEFLIGSSESYNVANTGDYVRLADLDLTTSTLTVNSLTLGTSAEAARTSLSAIDTAIGKVNEALGKIGAVQNRMEFAISNLKTSVQNFSAAESVIRDVDMAEEMTKFSKNQILSQAGTAMLAQANQSGQGVLQLLRG